MSAVTFGAFRLDLRRRTLTKDGGFVAINRRSLDVLCCLARARSQVLSKDELITGVWGAAAVDENYLHVLISGLRKVLGQAGRDHLVTVTGQGYRLLASTAIDEPKDSILEQPSVEIMPLRNLTSRRRNDALCFSVMEDLATRLSWARWISVVFSENVPGQRGAGVQRGTSTSYVLQGSLHAKESWRIGLRLIEVATGTLTWANHYNIGREEGFVAWDQAAAAIASAVQTAMFDAEQRRSLFEKSGARRAWDVFARGVWHFTQARYEDNEHAIALLTEAIDLDPNFAPAYYWLVYAHLQNGNHYQTCSALQACRVAEPVAANALHVDAGAAGSHASMGFIAKVGGDAKLGLAKAEQALARNPYDGDALRLKGGCQLALGFHQDGAKTLFYSVDIRPLDPQNWRAFEHLCNFAHTQGDYERAVEFGQEALRRNHHQTVTYPWLISSLARAGRIEDARVVIGHARAAAGSRPFGPVRYLWMEEAHHSRMLEGLRMAGWRE